MTTRVALVSCVKTKLESDAAAADMYTSPLFKGMRWYAKHNADSWLILSAKHGVLRPDQVIAPYECTLNTMSKRDRLAWAAQVQQRLLEVLPAGAEVVVLAGVPYRENVVPFLEDHGFTVEVPMVGLKLGPQLRWLKEHMRNEQSAC